MKFREGLFTVSLSYITGVRPVQCANTVIFDVVIKEGLQLNNNKFICKSIKCLKYGLILIWSCYFRIRIQQQGMKNNAKVNYTRAAIR